MNTNPFGKQLRYFRRRAQDPERGGSLTQERLTHLLYEVSHLDYSFAAVSDWERGKSQIPKDHRPTLVGLVATLGQYGGLLSVAEANEWLAAGNYRLLAADELAFLRTAGLTWPALTTQTEAGSLYAAPFLAPPRPFQPIVGRDDALTSLRERLLDREAVTISAVRGLPGVGKTTLAQLLAHDTVIQEAFPDGVLWIGLGRTPDVFFCLGLWADALAIDPTELRQMTAVGMRAAAIRSRLSNRAALLIIDDAWQAKQAGWFQLGGQDCAHIITTRLPAVTDAFGHAHRVIVETLAEAESVRLLAYLAPQVYEQFPTAVTQLAKESGGLPLTLMLIGNYLRQQAASGQHRRLEQALHHLQEPAFRLQVDMPQTAVHAHPSLSVEETISLISIIGVSETALSDNARQGLYALSLFPPKPNSFSEAAAAAIIAQPLEVLDELVDAGLVESKGQDRYQVHQAIADYLTAQANPTAKVHQRFIDYYANWLTAVKTDPSLVELETDNILAAITLARKIKAKKLLVNLVTDFLPYLEKRSLWDLVDQLTPQAIAYAEEVADYRAAIILLDKLGRSLNVRQQRDKAHHYLRQATALARQHQEVELLVSLLAQRSQLADAAGDIDLAREFLHEALSLSEATAYWHGVGLSLGYLGRLALQNEPAQAPLYLDKALAIAHQHSLHTMLCSLLILRAAAAYDYETMAAAESYYLEALDLARTVGRKDQLSAILTNLGEIETNRGEVERAIAYLEEALDIVRESGNVAREAHIHKDLGILAMRRGDAKMSQYHFETGLSLAEADENDWLAGYIAVHWAELALQNGNTNRAAQLANQVTTRLPDSGKNRSIIAIAYFLQAQLAAERDDWHLAHELARQSADSLQAVGHARAKEVFSWLEK